MMETKGDSPGDNAEKLVDFIQARAPLMVLTGAGCSTASGIPEYRDDEGEWKHRKPVQFQDFCRDQLTRQRYWARSLLGWPRLVQAQANDAHLALARLEQAGFVRQLVTQNVDGLHQKAGSKNVIDLHGQLESVTCLSCETSYPRSQVQNALRRANPAFREKPVGTAPDGDALLENFDFSSFELYDCPTCSGILKPDVVFFGESVPRQRVEAAMRSLDDSRGLLVIGSSLMVYSGYRFCKAAIDKGKHLCALNRGRTRADTELDLKIEDDCVEILNLSIALLGLELEAKQA